MDLQAQYEKDLEELKRLEGQEIPENDTEETEVEETIEEVESEEEVTEDETPEAPEQPVIEVVEPPKDHKAWADQRRENAALKREIAELAKKLEQPKQSPVNTDPEPVKEEEPLAWLEWDNRRVRKELEELRSSTVPEIEERKAQERKARAADEFTQYENRFKTRVPDYEQVGAHAMQQLRISYKNVAPHLSDGKVNEMIAEHILNIASQAARDGLDPAEEVYNTFKGQFGAPRIVPKEEPVKKLDLDRLDRSRKKSATALVGGGQGGSVPLTIKSAVTDMTNGEFAQLSPSQLRELEAQIR